MRCENSSDFTSTRLRDFAMRLFSFETIFSEIMKNTIHYFWSEVENPEIPEFTLIFR